MATRKLEVRLLGDSKSLQRTLGRSGKDVATFGKQVNVAGVKVKGAFRGMATSALKIAGVTSALYGVSRAIKGVASSTIEFDKGMRNVNSIAQLSEKRFKSLEKQVLSLAGKTAQSPKTLAEGLYDLVSSGFDAQQSMTILASSAKAATAGLTTTEISTKAVAAVLNAYHKPASEAAKVSDELFQTVNLGVVSFEQLAGTIGDVLPFSSQMGISLGQVGAALSTMTKAGIPPAEATTRLKNTIVAFIKPAEGMSNAIKETGFESGEALVKAKGFQGALEAVVGTTDGTKASVGKLFPNIRAMGGAFALTGKNANGAEKDLKGFKDVAGTTDKALSEQSKSISYKWNKLKATFEAIGITIGNKVIPVITDGLDAVGGFIDDVVNKFDSLKGLFDNLKLGGASTGEALTKTISAAFKNVPWAELGKTVADGVTGALGGIAGVLTDAFGAIDWSGVGSKMAAGISGGLNLAGKLPGLITAGLSQAFGQVNGEQVLGKLLDVIGQAVDSMFKPSFWIKHFAAIFSIVTLVIPVGKILKIPGFSFLFKWISKPFFKAIGLFGKGMLSLLKKVGDAAFTGFLAGLEKFAPKTAHLILELVTAAGKAMSALPGRLRGLAAKAVAAVVERLAGGAGKAGEAVGKVVGAAVAAAGKAAGSLAKKAAEWVRALAKAIIPGPVRKAMDLLRQKVVGAVTYIPKRMIEVGKDIILGLINGIKSKAEDLYKTVKGIAEKGVEFLKKPWKIFSPSRTAFEIGRFIGEGLALGIRGSESAVTKAANEGLLFPLDAAIAKLEAKQDRIQKAWDRIDAAAERSSLVQAIKDAGNTPLDVTSPGGGSGGSTHSSASGTGTGPLKAHGNTVVDALSSIAKESGLTVTSTTGGTHVVGSNHYKGLAVDAAGTADQMMAFAREAMKQFGPKLLELFYDPLGKYVKNGQTIQGAIGGHSDHVHIAAPSVGALASTGGTSQRRATKKSKSGGGLNKTFPLTRVGKGGAQLSENQLRAVFESAGFSPAEAMWMAKVSGRESGGRPGIVQYDPGDGNVGYGLTQITPGRNGANWGGPRSATYRKFLSLGGAQAMRNPMVNAQMARYMFQQSGVHPWDSSSRSIPMVTGNVKSVGKITGGMTTVKDDSNRKDAIKQAKQALSDFDKAAKRAQKSARIDLQIKGLEKMKAWKDALTSIGETLDDTVSSAVDAFGDQWEKTIGVQLDRANDKALQSIDDLAAGAQQRLQDVHAAALSAFDAVTQSLVTNGPAARALAALQAQEDAIRTAAEDASNKQSLDDARRSGDPRQIKTAQAAIDETNRQRAITAAQAAADAERDQIEAQRGAQRVELERQQQQQMTDLTREQADARQAIEDEQGVKRAEQYKADSDAFSSKLKADLDAEYATLTSRGQNYASFVRNVNAILAKLGSNDTSVRYSPDASTEAAVSAGPAMGVVARPGSALWNAQWLQAFEGTHPGKTLDASGNVVAKRASGGLIDYGRVYRVNEVGEERFVRMPAGGTGVVPASRVAMQGGRGGPAVVMNNVTIGSQRAATALANRLNYDAKYRP